jgi:hypothetical protein
LKIVGGQKKFCALWAQILPHHDSILSPPGFLNFEITPAEKKASDASDGNNLSNSHILACRYTT